MPIFARILVAFSLFSDKIISRVVLFSTAFRLIPSEADSCISVRFASGHTRAQILYT